MKNKLASIAVIVILLAANANAQQGFGIQMSIMSPISFGNFGASILGAGLGVEMFPRWVFSLNGDIGGALFEDQFPGVFHGEFYLEYATSMAYRFSNLNSTPYVFAGYHNVSSEYWDKSVGFVEAGVGYAPFKGSFGLYFELSILIPLEQTVKVQQFLGPLSMKVPLVIRFTIKIYYVPSSSGKK